MIKVFKFGGASVKDAAAVRNVASILKDHQSEKLVVIVSAMGKTTNALEQLAQAHYYGKDDKFQLLENVKTFHRDILNELFPEHNTVVFDDIENLFVALEWELDEVPGYSYDHVYDQIVSFGELLSTHILSLYLKNSDINCKLIDARDIIKTDNTYREAKILWTETVECVNKFINFKDSQLYLTQGFLGCNDENFTTTLGREGSDYTAAIIAYCLNADEVTIWKDVPGVLNADPKYFDETTLLSQLSYQDAIELTYYGATVIHPKTIKPLQNKNIPLNVRSFVKPSESGSAIGDFNIPLSIPSYIFKVDQVLISISPRDFSFIAEDNLSKIYALIASLNVKVNIQQNSALNFSICIDNDEKAQQLIEKLKSDYRVLYNENVELVTIRYYNQQTIDKVTENKIILLEQKSRTTAQLVMKNVL